MKFVKKTHKITALIMAVLLCGLISCPNSLAAGLMGDYIKITAPDGSETMRLIDAYNSGRASDQMIVYDSDFGGSTMTNAYGIEVVVSGSTDGEGKVTSVENGVGNAVIPSDGYVISANGEARKWLTQSLSNTGEGYRVAILKNHLLTEEIKFSFELDGINPTGEYGGRGANKLVYYDKDCKKATTETNNYGYEVVVENGITTKISGNNSAIPQNGFVLSAHGSRKNELYEIPLGALVSVKGNTVTVAINAQSVIEGARLRVEDAEWGYKKAIDEFRDIDSGAKTAIDDANKQLEKAEGLLKSKSIRDAILAAQRAENDAETANMLLSTSRVVEGRGIWYNPTETTQSQVAATMDKIEAAGLNMVFLQTVYWGYAIYPDSPTYRQFPQLDGFDLLKAFIDEGHKRGIEVHAWVHVMRATTVPNVDEGSMGYILDAHPNWVMKDRQGKAATSWDETSGYYYNPAHPEVRAFLRDTYTDLVKRYDIDGLQLDYIRFPMEGTASDPYERGHSYDDYTIGAVKRELGFSPLDITPDDTDKWAKWTEWRQRQVSEVVDMLVGEVKKVKPNVIISADVVPEESGKEYKLQDWRNWVEKGLIELIAPMTYSLDTEYVRSTTEEFANLINKHSYIYVGVGPYLEGYDETTLNTQVESLKTTKTLGTSMFSLNTMAKEELNLLGTGPFRKRAVTPHGSPAKSISLLVDDLKRKMADIYIAGGGMTEEQSAAVSSMLDDVVRTASGVGTASKVYAETGERLKEIKGYLAGPTGINAEVTKRITEDVEYMLTLSDCAVNIVKGRSDGIGSVTLKVFSSARTSEEPYTLIDSDITMLPLRAVAEAMGGEVLWNGDESKITVIISHKTIDLWLGSDQAVTNGETEQLDTSVRSINGVTFVPMRFLTGNFGCVISYNGQNSEITVKF